MDNSTAVNLINNLHYMPGWSFEAFDTGGPSIVTRATIETVNSNQDQAFRRSPERITLERNALVHPVDYATENDLTAALFTWIMEIQIHETREFLRVGKDLRAPFHPHRPEGEQAWDDLIIRGTDPMRGLYVLNV